MGRVGLYVDVENLLDIAKEAIKDTFERWPEELPRPSILNLYVKAVKWESGDFGPEMPTPRWIPK